MSSVIDSLPQGLQFIIGEDGQRLSGGQRQRIGIARALYSRKKLLILDEATNALDMSTENNIIKLIRSNYPDLTVVMVTHRHDMLKYCDKVIDLVDDKRNSSEVEPC